MNQNYKIFMKFYLIFLAPFFILGCQERSHNKHAQPGENKVSEELVYAKPAEVGMSSDKIEEAVKLYADAVEENKVIGYQILVLKNSKVIIHEAGGLRDLENQLPMDKNTLINVASNTKSLTAISVLKLAEDELLNIEDYVHEYLPGFDSAYSKQITIRQLLLHQGGFMDFNPFVGEISQKSIDNPEAPSLIVEAKKIGISGPEKIPGTVYRYNNMGYNILAAIVEKVSGLKLDEYFKKNFYDPLGMTSTFHFKHQFDTTQMAKQYYLYNNKWAEMEVMFPPFARGNSGAISTAYDFAKLFQMLVNQGIYNNSRILKASTVEAATSPIIKVSEAYLSEEIEKELGLPDSEWYEFRDSRELNIDKHRGYGFVVSDNGGFSHAGIYGTFAYADPKEELVIILFSQSIYGGNPGQKFIEIIYDSMN